MPNSVTISVGADTTQLERSINQALQKISRTGSTINLPLGRITGDAKNFDSALASATQRVVAFGASLSVLYSSVQAFKNIVSATIEVNKALTDINSTLRLSSQNLSTFQKSLFDTARSTTTSFQEAAQAAQLFSRQGLSVQETLKRTTDALTLAKIAGISVTESVEDLTAATNNFSKSGITTTDALSKIATLSSRFAISSKDISEGLTKVSSTAQNAGVNFNQLLGLITSAQQITQRGGSAIGTSLNTIFTRLGNPETLNKLQAFGVQVRDSSHQIVPMITLLGNLAQAYDKLGTDKKSTGAIDTLLGGARQLNILKATLEGLNTAGGLFAQTQKVLATNTQDATLRLKTQAESFQSLLENFKTTRTQIESNAGSLVLGGPLKSLFGGQSNILIDSLKDADGQAKTVGGKIGEGLIKGIGDSLIIGGGPIIAAALFKITRSTFGLLFKDLQSQANLLQPGNKQLTLQEKIVTLYNAGDVALKKQLATMGQLVNASSGLATNLSSGGVRQSLANSGVSRFFPNGRSLNGRQILNTQQQLRIDAYSNRGILGVSQNGILDEETDKLLKKNPFLSKSLSNGSNPGIYDIIQQNASPKIDLFKAKQQEAEAEVAQQIAAIKSQNSVLIAQQRQASEAGKIIPILSKRGEGLTGVFGTEAGDIASISGPYGGFNADRRAASQLPLEALRQQRFANRQNAVLAGSFALPLVGGAISRFEGQGGSASGIGFGAASGALNGAGLGLGLGTLTGNPIIGAAAGGIGAAIGGIVGALGKINKTYEELTAQIDKRDSESENTLKDLREYIDLREARQQAIEDGATPDTIARFDRNQDEVIKRLPSFKKQLLTTPSTGLEDFYNSASDTHSSLISKDTDLKNLLGLGSVSDSQKAADSISSLFVKAGINPRTVVQSLAAPSFFPTNGASEFNFGLQNVFKTNLSEDSNRQKIISSIDTVAGKNGYSKDTISDLDKKLGQIDYDVLIDFYTKLAGSTDFDTAIKKIVSQGPDVDKAVTDANASLTKQIASLESFSETIKTLAEFSNKSEELRANFVLGGIKNSFSASNAFNSSNFKDFLIPNLAARGSGALSLLDRTSSPEQLQNIKNDQENQKLALQQQDEQNSLYLKQQETIQSFNVSSQSNLKTTNTTATANSASEFAKLQSSFINASKPYPFASKVGNFTDVDQFQGLLDSDDGKVLKESLQKSISDYNKVIQTGNDNISVAKKGIDYQKQRLDEQNILEKQALDNTQKLQRQQQALTQGISSTVLQGQQQTELLTKGQYNPSNISQLNLSRFLAQRGDTISQLQYSQLLTNIGVPVSSSTGLIQQDLQKTLVRQNLSQAIGGQLGKRIGTDNQSLFNGVAGIAGTGDGESASRYLNAIKALNFDSQAEGNKLLTSQGGFNIKSLVDSGKITLGEGGIINPLTQISENTATLIKVGNQTNTILNVKPGGGSVIPGLTNITSNTTPNAPTPLVSDSSNPNSTQELKDSLIKIGIPLTDIDKVLNQIKNQPIGGSTSSTNILTNSLPGFSQGFNSFFDNERDQFTQFANVGHTIASNLQNDLGSVWDKFVTGQEKGNQAFRQFLSGIFADTSKAFGQQAIGSILTDVFGSQKKAQGGFIHLANGGSVPAMLTGGEYVFNPNQARRLGPQALRSLNAGHYASGGVVTGGSGVRDDVPANLQPGSFVVKAPSVRKYGSGFLNKLAGGDYVKRDVGGFLGGGGAEFGIFGGLIGGILGLLLDKNNRGQGAAIGGILGAGLGVGANALFSSPSTPSVSDGPGNPYDQNIGADSNAATNSPQSAQSKVLGDLGVKFGLAGASYGIAAALRPNPQPLGFNQTQANALQLEANNQSNVNSRPAGSFVDMVRGKNGQYNIISNTAPANEFIYGNNGGTPYGYNSGGTIAGGGYTPLSDGSTTSNVTSVNPVITIHNYGNGNTTSSVSNPGASDKNSNPLATQEFANTLNKHINAAVNEALVNSQRNGGLFNTKSRYSPNNFA